MCGLPRRLWTMRFENINIDNFQGNRTNLRNILWICKKPSSNKCKGNHTIRTFHMELVRAVGSTPRYYKVYHDMIKTTWQNGLNVMMQLPWSNLWCQIRCKEIDYNIRDKYDVHLALCQDSNGIVDHTTKKLVPARVVERLIVNSQSVWYSVLP